MTPDLSYRYYIEIIIFSCNVCRKTFFKRYYNRHLARHNDVAKHQCDIRGRVFARLDNFLRHRRSQHDDEPQTGHGDILVDETAPERRRIMKVTDLYHVYNVKEVQVKKFNTKGMTYTVKFNDSLDVHDPTVILETLHRVFESLLDTLTKGAAPHDLIRIVVTCAELDYPIYTTSIYHEIQINGRAFLSQGWASPAIVWTIFHW